MPWRVQRFRCFPQHEAPQTQADRLSRLLVLAALTVACCRVASAEESGAGGLLDYFNYNVGDSLDVACPPGWSAIGTICFNVVQDNGVLKMAIFDEAKQLCNSQRYGFSRPFAINNWFISNMLAVVVRSAITTAAHGGMPLSYEAWTSFYLESDDALFLNVTNSDEYVSIYNSLWAPSEPKQGAVERCVAFDSDYKARERTYGWKLRNCSTPLPVVCQTFSCYKNHTRCADNSKCIPLTALCDGVADCNDLSDEDRPECLHRISSMQRLFTDEFGVITGTASMCSESAGWKNCEWQIRRPPGASITVTILNAKLFPGEQLIVYGAGDSFNVTNDGPVTYTFDSNDLTVRYHALAKYVDRRGNMRGFRFHYTSDAGATCVTEFDAWNGTFRTPMRIHDQRHYRANLDCEWTVRKFGSTLLSAHISDYELAEGDELTIFQGDADGRNLQLIGKFNHHLKPPTALVATKDLLKFKFHSQKKSEGASGFLVNFQQSCMNVYLAGDFGEIESPGFRQPEERFPSHCSWIVDTSCFDKHCGITFYFDLLNLTNKDLITIEAGVEVTSIDAATIPVLFHRVNSPRALLQMFGRTAYFAGKISYSIDCVVPMTVGNTMAKFENTPPFYRSTAEFRCKGDSRTHKVQCEQGGRWSSPPPNCDARLCRFPNVTGGYITKVTQSPLQTLDFTCQRGFVTADLKTNGSANCTLGKWNPTPHCSEILCSSPDDKYINNNASSSEVPWHVPAVLQGVATGSVKYLQQVYYACPPFTSLRGESAVRVCGQDGKWTNPILYCKKSMCADTKVPNGFLEPDYVFPGQSANVTCYADFEPNVQTVRCLENGTWHVEPACTASSSGCDCGYGTCSIEWGVRVCTCAKGFKQSAPEGVCEDIDECAMGLDLCAPFTTCVNTNGSYYCAWSSNDTFAVYNKHWSKQQAFPETKFIFDRISIVRKRCPKLSTNGVNDPSQSLHLVDEWLRVRCAMSLHDETLQCAPNMTWSSEIHCPSISKCLAPKVPVITTYVGSVTKLYYDVGDVVSFSCPYNYDLVGPNRGVCIFRETGGTVNVTFSAEPKCVPKSCAGIDNNTQPGLLVFPSDSEEPFAVGTILTFQCKSGRLVCNDLQSLSGCPITCLLNYTWSGSLPTCDTNCRIAPEGDLVPSNTLPAFGEGVTFSCVQPNYVVSEHAPVRCGSDTTSTPGGFPRTTPMVFSIPNASTGSFTPNEFWTTHAVITPSTDTTKGRTIRSPRECIHSHGGHLEVASGASTVIFCNLHPECFELQVNFRTLDTNTELSSTCLEGQCFVFLESVTLKDDGKVVCEVLNNDSNVIDSAVMHLHVSTERHGTSWKEQITKAKPLVQQIFGLVTNPEQWHHSLDWSWKDGIWRHKLTGNRSNLLATPMIRIQSESVSVFLKISDVPSHCSVKVSYFTANYFISEVPKDKFKILAELNVHNTSITLNLKVVYSLLWIMMSADNCDHVSLEEMEIDRVSCPSLQLDQTRYPVTTTTLADILVIGSCFGQASQASFRPMLVCTSNGHWKLASDHRPPGGCFCSQGVAPLEDLCHAQRPLCYECRGPTCTAPVAKRCGVGESCETRVEVHGEALVVEKRCSRACVSHFDNLQQCLGGHESCTYCCSSDYCNGGVAVGHDINKRNFMSSALPQCVDKQPIRMTCAETISVKQNKYAFSEATHVPWPEVHDNDPHFRISADVSLFDRPKVFDMKEKVIHWTAVDKHGKSTNCTTNIVFEDNEEPKLKCPDLHLDMRSGTRTKFVPMHLPAIEIHDLSNVQLVFSPLNNSVVEIDRPVLVNVTAIDEAGNLARCQFWYTAVAADCPLWKLDMDVFTCTQSESITICYRRNPCLTRELPRKYKAIVCIPGQRWRYVLDDSSTSRLNENDEMVRSPVCLEQQSSSITLSITFRTQTLIDSCLEAFSTAMENKFNVFIKSHCTNVGWEFQAKESSTKFITLNFTTSNTDTDVVLACIADITDSLGRELPQVHLPCPAVVRSHTITYHVYCSPGWGANTNLKCEQCPPGYFSLAEVCEPCPQGSYSSVSGAHKCKECDAGMSTMLTAAVSAEECVPLCGPGFYSKNGLAPCLSCPHGTFQELTGQIGCDRCPFNSTTVHVAAESRTDCVSICRPGFYSSKVGGAEPCLKCPTGFYQDSSGAEECKLCPPGTTTLTEGSANAFKCIDQECPSIPCMNGGICKDAHCHCPFGFAGVDCSVVVNRCHSEYCLNGGTCLFNSTGSSCRCPDDFQGLRCETKADFNLQQQNAVKFGQTGCLDINKCLNGVLQEDCSCRCNEHFQTAWNGTCVLEVCGFQPCVEGGSCAPVGNTSNHTSMNFNCTCSGSDVQGAFCEQHNLVCSPNNPCANGGTCTLVAVTAGYTSVCACAEAFGGEYCHTLTPCQSNPCVNGVCVSYGSDYYCNCADGFVGELCDIRVPVCYDPWKMEYPCSNNGTCDQSAGFCNCPEGWTGLHCERPNNTRCEHGTFRNGTCHCDPGFTGSLCAIPIDPCKNDPEGDFVMCGAGRCTQLSLGYKGRYNCTCRPGWTNASHCFVPVDQCSSKPCGVNGVCVNNVDDTDYTCLCSPGFTGQRCQEVINYCSTPDICLGSKCLSLPTGFHCEDACDSVLCLNGFCEGNGTCRCNPGFTGPQCDLPICDCAGWCVEKSACSCQCKPGFTGEKCDKILTDPSFNLFFSGNEIVTSKLVEATQLRSFTLCAWVSFRTEGVQQSRAARFEDISSQDVTLFSIAEMRDQAGAPPKFVRDLLTVRNGRVQVANNLLKFNWNWTQSQTWNHICVQTPLTSGGQWTVFVNSVPQTVQESAYFVNPFWDTAPNARFAIRLSSSNNAFRGELSLVELHDRTIDSGVIADMVYNCERATSSSTAAIKWTEYSLCSKSDRTVLIRPGVCFLLGCQVLSAQCAFAKDKTPPRIKYCPPNQVKYTDHRISNVHIANATIDDIFDDDDTIVSTSSNYRNGQAFQWGQYRIVFSATDTSGNTATCEFVLTVGPNNTQLVASSNPSTIVKIVPIYNGGNQVGDNYASRMYAEVTCKDTNWVVPVRHSKFFTCDALGRWDCFADTYGTPFAFPECTKAMTPGRQVTGSFVIQASQHSCEQIKYDTRQLILNETGLCKGHCFTELSVQCLHFPEHRWKRDATNNSQELVFELFVRDSPYPIREKVLSALRKYLNAIVEMSTENPKCPPNFPVLVHSNGVTKCAEVGRGYVWDNTTKEIVPCPKNTFKNVTGNVNCSACPEGKITGGTASVSENECFDACSPGHVFDMNSKSCQPCPTGTFQNMAGRLVCRSCDSGLTTNGPGSTSEHFCQPCQPGQELAPNGACAECPTGTFRNDSMPHCVSCDLGFTTDGSGKSSPSDCNVVFCPKGTARANVSNVNQVLLSFLSVCIPCDRGFFQDQLNQDSCTPCATGTTTAKNGSTSRAKCIQNSQFACSPESNDGCDDPSTECRCTTWNGQLCHSYKCVAVPVPAESRWWIALLVSVFLILLVMVILVIVWRRPVVNMLCQCCRLPDSFVELFPERLQKYLKTVGQPRQVPLGARRSRHNSLASVSEFEEQRPEIKESDEIVLPRLTVASLPDRVASTDSMAIEETSLTENNLLNQIKESLQSLSEEKEPEASPPPPKLTRPRSLPRPVGLTVQTSQHSLLSAKGVFQNERGRKVHAVSAEGHQDYTFRVQPTTSFVPGPPSSRYMHDRLVEMSVNFGGGSSSLEELSGAQSPGERRQEWSALNGASLLARRNSSSSSEVLDYSDDRAVHLQTARAAQNTSSFSMHRDYFCQTGDMSEAVARARSVSSSVASARQESSSRFSKNQSQVFETDSKKNVDHDLDAFFS